MERILNDEEKIRRAEEIYYRRNNQEYPLANKKQEKRKCFVKEKILLNLIIMFNLAVLVFCIKNSSYIFTNEFLENLNKYNTKVTDKIIKIFGDFLNSENAEEIIEENIQTEKNEEVVNVESVEKDVVENKTENSISSINEMELDINNLKAAYNLGSPLKGIVSSKFGARESKYQNVKGYHTGIDIVANEGTSIVSSMEGIVELVSSEGDYGKHIKIRCNNVYTLYAHCSKIFVKEGQIVAKGQKIAEVGNTGNSTGPHLHFEIRVEDRFVDPAKVVSF